MKIAERRAALGKGPVYLYYFRWETPVDGGRLKSPHTIEIPFAFDNVKASPADGRRARGAGAGRQGQRRLDRVRADRRSEHAASCRAGRRSTRSDRPTMVFNNESTVVNDPIREQRLAMFAAKGLAG